MHLLSQNLKLSSGWPHSSQSRGKMDMVFSFRELFVFFLKQAMVSQQGKVGSRKNRVRSRNRASRTPDLSGLRKTPINRGVLSTKILIHYVNYFLNPIRIFLIRTSLGRDVLAAVYGCYSNISVEDMQRNSDNHLAIYRCETRRHSRNGQIYFRN